ncbi:hypothetical protein PVL29_002501 [Vitis rotundifolia]|uniref:MADS-box domain-containing protein n=1 Tax=Vitis rotundifolia TaxID=103349 RepID=A0AA39E3X4_VITRO|nr:hypothetical protein PVL29_002501 [Vitis rotundifolia]
MARKKVKLQWIVNDTARKATYKKRVKGLMKKVKELSILCGVDACAITYSPYHQQPEVWPSPSEVERVLAEFKSRPENDQTKKVLNQENFTWQRITKARDELGKQQKKNRKSEIEHLRTQCLSGKRLEGLESRDLGDLMWAIDDQLEAVKHRMSLVPVARPQVAGAGGSSSSNAGIGGTIAGIGGVGDVGGVVGAGASRGMGMGMGIGMGMGMGMGVSNVGAFAGVSAVLSGIGTFSGVVDAPPYAALPGTTDSVSGIGALSDVGGGGVPGVVSLPFSSINGAGAGAGAALGTGAAGSAIGAAQKTSFELAIEALENQIFMEQNQQIQNENMVNVLGDQEMLPLDYDVSNFWRNPYIH